MRRFFLCSAQHICFGRDSQFSAQPAILPYCLFTNDNLALAGSTSQYYKGLWSRKHFPPGRRVTVFLCNICNHVTSFFFGIFTPYHPISPHKTSKIGQKNSEVGFFLPQNLWAFVYIVLYCIHPPTNHEHLSVWYCIHPLAWDVPFYGFSPSRMWRYQIRGLWVWL